MKIGFLGLGIMGAPMAGHLIAGGYSIATAVHNSPAPADLVDRGLNVLHTPADVADGADVVITMVSDTPDVEEVLFSKGASPPGCRLEKQSSI